MITNPAGYTARQLEPTYTLIQNCRIGAHDQARLAESLNGTVHRLELDRDTPAFGLPNDARAQCLATCLVEIPARFRGAKAIQLSANALECVVGLVHGPICPARPGDVAHGAVEPPQYQAAGQCDLDRHDEVACIDT